MAVTSIVAPLSAPVPLMVAALVLVMASLLLLPLSEALTKAKDFKAEGAGAVKVALQVTAVAACRVLVWPARSVDFKPRLAVEPCDLTGKVKKKEPSVSAKVSPKTVLLPSNKMTLAPASAPCPLTS